MDILRHESPRLKPGGPIAPHPAPDRRPDPPRSARLMSPASASIRLRLRPYQFRREYGHRVRWLAGAPRVILWGAES